jgi:16S rRNA (guanine527-N7)-methyltransferase
LKEPLRQQLETGLREMGLYFPLPMQQKLIHFIQLIARWNKTFNLTAVRDVEDMVSRHLLDCLAVQPYIEGNTVLDVGSGAGLPGIPFAITLPNKTFVLIDSNGKKTRFLTQAKIELGLENVTVVNRRVEDYFPEKDGHRIYFDVITARAWAATDAILVSTRHLQHENTCILVMQGKLDERIDSQQYHLAGSHKLDIYGLDVERHLLEIKRL